MLFLLARLSNAVSIEATGWLWCDARLIVLLEGSPRRRGYGGAWATANNACIFSTLFGMVQPGKHYDMRTTCTGSAGSCSLFAF